MSLPIASPAAQQGATQRNKEKDEICHPDCKPSTENDLQNRQYLAVAMLLRGLPDAQVAQRLGVDRGTVFRWRKDPVIARMLAERQRAVLAQANACMDSMLAPALRIIRKHMRSKNPRIALAAAALLLRMATRQRGQQTQQSPGIHPQPASRADPAFNQLMAFVDAPMPDDPGYNDYMALLNAGEFDDIEVTARQR